MRMPSALAIVPRNALGIAVLSIVTIAAVVGGWIWPNLRHERVRLAMIEEVKSKIAAQQILAPLQAALLKRLSERPPLPGEVMLHDGLKPQPISLDQANQTLMSLANENGLAEPNFTPAPDSLAGGKKRLLVHGKVKGDLNNFRGFMLTLSASGYFDGLESLEIRRPAGALEYSLKIWVLIS